MADIQIGSHRIRSDTHGWMVAEEKERGPDAKDPGSMYLTNKKYVPSLQAALLKLQDERIRQSDAESIEDVLREIERFRAALSGAFAITVVEPEG